jgi:hypothetical protein
MTLKYQLDSLDGLDENQKALYQEKDGKYVLSIDGMPEDKTAEFEDRIARMEAKNEQLLSEKKSEQKKRRDEEEKRARESGDIDALNQSWQEKLDTLAQDNETKVSSLTRLLENQTIRAQAIAIASELAVQGSAEVLEHSILPRLSMEIKDGEIKTVVKSKDGKPSALTLDELKNEYINNPAFAPLIVGSKAAGGGANGSNQNGGAGTANPFQKGEHFNLTKQAEILRDNPAKAEQLKALANQQR